MSTKIQTSNIKLIFSDKSFVNTFERYSEITGTVTVTDHLDNSQTLDASYITLTDSPIFVER